MTSPTSLARARVHVTSIRLDRDGAGRKIAHLRLRQPAKNTVVSAISTKAEHIDAIFARDRDTLWAALIDRTNKQDLRVLELRPLPQA